MDGLLAEDQMSASRQIGGWRAQVALGVLLLGGVQGLKADDAEFANGVAVYDADPKHVWNRVYATFYVRTTVDGKSTGHDELDAPLWRKGEYLMKDASHARAVEVLDEFIQERSERLFPAGLKRAILQRDLWAVFDYLASPQPWMEEWRKDQQLTEGRDALLRRLAIVIRRLAMSREAIEGLADNFQLTAAAETYPRQYDPTNRQRAFLPADLLEKDGSWVSYGEADAVTAMQHHRTYSGRSVVHVRLRLRGGREATVDSLRRHPARSVNTIGAQFEAGTQVALVKQALLIDDGGQIRPARITEQAQLRVIHQWENPDGYEFLLSRRKLFEGTGGGLVPISDGELHFSAFREMRRQSPLDPFEHTFPEASMPIPLARAPSENQNLKKTCLTCHQTRAGVGSFLTTGPVLDRESLIRTTISWKQKDSTWGRLQGLMAVSE